MHGDIATNSALDCFKSPLSKSSTLSTNKISQQACADYQVEDDTEILIRYNVRGRGPKFWTGT